MSTKVRSDSNCLKGIQEYIVQKRWVAVAILIGTLLVCGALLLLGTLALLYGTIGSTGAITCMAIGKVGLILGLIVSILLLIRMGRTPLHKAIEKKAPLDELLKTRNVNETDHNGNTPLHYAIKHGYGLEKLLDIEGVDVNARNMWGDTPLLAAVKAGKKEAVEQLLAHPNVMIDQDTLERAIGGGTEEIALMLIHADRYQGSWRDLLLTAISKGKTTCVQAILNKYPNENHPDLVHALVELGFLHPHNPKMYSEILDMLLGKNVEINSHSPGHYGRTALHHACIMKNKVELVSKLLSIDGIDVNVEDIFGKTPIQRAMEEPWISTACLIIHTGKLSEKNLEKTRQQARETEGGEYGTDCSKVFEALDAVSKKQ